MKQGGELTSIEQLGAGGYRILRIFVRDQTHKKKLDGKRARKHFAGRFVYLRIALPRTWNSKTRRWNHKRRDIYLGPAAESQGGERAAARAAAASSDSGWRKGREKAPIYRMEGPYTARAIEMIESPQEKARRRALRKMLRK